MLSTLFSSERSTYLRRHLLLTFFIALTIGVSFGQSNTNVYKVTSPIHALASQLGTPDDKAEPYHSGIIVPGTTAKALIESLGGDSSKPTIIHILRWKDKDHSTVSFQKWYFYDPTPPWGRGLYLQTKEQAFQRTATPGYKDFQFIYMHLNATLSDGDSEWAQRIPVPPPPVGITQSLTGGMLSSGSTVYVKITAMTASGESVPSSEASVTLNAECNAGSACSVAVPMPSMCRAPAGGITGCTVYSSASSEAEQQQSASTACVNITADSCVIGVVGAGSSPPTTPTLLHPVNYTITVTKAQTQFIQDLKTALQILGLQVPGGLRPVAPSPGYFSTTTFQSEWTTSGITIAASLDSANKNQGKNQNSATNSLSSNTYTNEKPSWVGLSAGVQITSYKDITYQSSSGTLVPSSITKQDVYFFLDGYLPPVVPSLASFRYIPQPFFGLPIKGEVLRHSMFGVGIGMHWLEPFGGVVFDTQNNEVKGTTTNKTGITYKYVFGLKLSMSAVGKALKSK